VYSARCRCRRKGFDAFARPLIFHARGVIINENRPTSRPVKILRQGPVLIHFCIILFLRENTSKKLKVRQVYERSKQSGTSTGPPPVKMTVSYLGAQSPIARWLGQLAGESWASSAACPISCASGTCARALWMLRWYRGPEDARGRCSQVLSEH